MACALTLVVPVRFAGRLEAQNLATAPAFCELAFSQSNGAFASDLLAAAFLVGPLLMMALVFMLVAGRQAGAYAETFWAAPPAGVRQFMDDVGEILSAGFVRNGQIFYL